MKPTSKMGTVPVRRNCENGARGRGRPRALRSGTVARSSTRNNGSSTRGGSRRNTSKQLDRETLHVTTQDIWRRAYRDPNPVRAALRQIDGDLGAAVSRANNQHVLVLIRPRIAVIHRVNQGSIESARPSRHMRKPGKTRRYHHHPRGNRASRRLDTPVAVIAVKTRDFNAEPRLEAMVRRILLQVLHELVACHPSAEVTWIR